MAWAVVTGASSGIGWEFAKVLAREGYDVFALARREERLKQLKQEIEDEFGQDVVPIVVDLSQPVELENAYKTARAHSQNIEVLINNAGFGLYGPFQESDLNTNLQMIDLNIRALTHLTQLAVADFTSEKRLGYICNVASTAAFQPGPLMAIYFATKAYVLSFSEAIAEELAEKNVYVSALCPGPTKSEFGNVANFGTHGDLSKVKLPTSQEVAEYGYRSMKAGKPAAIHGTLNWVLASANRLAPREVVTRLARKMIERA